MNKLRVGICGWGNVATGLFKTLQTNSVEIKKRSNLEIEIIAIGARRDNPKCDPVSEDGRYFLYGQMFKIDLQTANVGADLYGSYKSLEPSVKNLTDLDMFEKRRSLMKEIQESELITFKAVNEKHSLTIFTDVDCGYCRKLHKQIKEYNDLGISIKYAAFPRSGLGTDTFTKMAGAWCSEDTKKVLTSLKDGKEPRLEFCESQPVAKHYAIGKKIGITGTPAIITNEGELLPGYYSPQDLLKKLKS